MHRLMEARRAFVAAFPDRDAHLARIGAFEARFATLSERERQVLAYVASGLANKQIASRLGIAEVTVKLHRGSMMQKMDAGSLIDLVRMWDALVSFAGQMTPDRS